MRGNWLVDEIEISVVQPGQIEHVPLYTLNVKTVLLRHLAIQLQLFGRKIQDGDTITQRCK